MLDSIIIIALISVTLIFVIKKHKVFRQFCEFCAGFWIAVVLTLFFGYWHGWDFSLIIYPFASAAITSLINRFIWQA